MVEKTHAIDNVHIHIDGGNASHDNGRGFFCVTTFTCAMINVPNKFGLITNSSTEIEVTLNGERFPKCSWFRNFRISQLETMKPRKMSLFRIIRSAFNFTKMISSLLKKFQECSCEIFLCS